MIHFVVAKKEVLRRLKSRLYIHLLRRLIIVLRFERLFCPRDADHIDILSSCFSRSCRVAGGTDGNARYRVGS